MKKRKSRKAVNNENKCIRSAVKSFTRVYTIVRPLTQNLARSPPPNNSIQQSGQQQQALKWKTSTDIIFEGIVNSLGLLAQSQSRGLFVANSDHRDPSPFHIVR